MVYKEQFVTVVKSLDGKILREVDGIVTLPFQSEYSLLLKNLNSQAASVRVFIDGQNVLYGNSLAIYPNTEVDLLGWMNGNTVTNRFKFIQKTEKIQQHRGDKIDDGIIKVEFAFEKKKEVILQETIKGCTNHYFYNYNPPLMSSGVRWGNDGVYTSSLGSRVVGCSASNISARSSSSDMSEVGESVQAYFSNSKPLDEEGITVPGSQVNQQFEYVSLGELNDYSTIIIRLKGTTSSGKQVKVPLTVKSKLKCKTCGTVSKSNAKFCSECGTSLL